MAPMIRRTHALALAALSGSVLAVPVTAALAVDPVGTQEEATKAAEASKSKVTGAVTFDGEIPEAKPLKVPEKAAAGCCPPGQSVDATDLSLVISEKGGIQGVFVSAKVEGAKVDVPEKAVEMDQKGCRFLPHLLVVPVGTKVAFLNSDETSHNVHLITVLNEKLNQTVLAGSRLERTFEKAERIKVTCDMHTWMRAWVVVTDATHWAVTDADGSFTIEGLPPGEHELKFWHETLGSKTAKVTVDESGKAEPVALKMAKKKSKKRRRRR